LPFKDIFVFGALKKDLNTFETLVIKKKPRYIVGIAIVKRGISRFESVAINQFQGNKKCSSRGKKEYSLFMPLTPSLFPVNKNHSDSFCNWTMYKISEFLEKNQSDTKLIFIHLRPEDIGVCANLVKFILKNNLYTPALT